MSSNNVSGPINIIKLEGQIFGINKELYVYFDVHLPIQMQTRCMDIFSDTIITFLAKQFKNTNKNIDFFLETFPSTLKYEHTYQTNYLNELRQFMSQAFNYNAKKDKVMPSSLFPKVRLHYIDIRDYLFWRILWDEYDALWSIFKRLYDRVLFVNSNDIYSELKAFNDNLIQFETNIKSIQDLLFNQSKQSQKTSRQIIGTYGEEKSNEIKKSNTLGILEKLFELYHHPEVKEEMLEIINNIKPYFEFVLQNIEEMFQLLEEIKSLIEINQYSLNTTNEQMGPNYYSFSYYGPDTVTLSKKMNDLYHLMDIINMPCKNVSAMLVDVYFLRRFLDKDYITDAIVYAGAFHAMMHIYILVNKFDFRVTSGSYLKKGINKTNDIIQKATKPGQIGELFMPKELYQCSNISSFPVKRVTENERVLI